jgi:hypothetical protein
MNDPKRKQIVDALVDAAVGDKGIRATYQKALGSLAINFSLLHFHLEMFSWEVFAVDHQTGQILTKDLPTTKLVHKLRSCCDRRAIEPTQRTQLFDLFTRIEKAAERRNELLHNLWFIYEGQPAFCYKRGSSKGKVHPAPTASEITEFARSIEILILMLVDFKNTASISIPSFAGEGHPNSIIPHRP